MRNILSLVVVFCLLIGLSCTPQKKLIYLQTQEEIQQEKLIDHSYLLRNGDLLTVNVYSINEKAMEVFGQSQRNATSVYNSDVSVYHNGFLVTDSGYVNFPLIGKVYATGKSLKEVSDDLESKLRDYFPDAVVNIKLINFNITVMGEVRSPGNYRLIKSRMNIFEAIAIAGDMTTYGRREVYVIRETSQGPKIVELDLKSQKVLESEYFYLMPNDIVYVRPHRAKVFGFEAVPIGIILSSVSTILVIINFLK